MGTTAQKQRRMTKKTPIAPGRCWPKRRAIHPVAGVPLRLSITMSQTPRWVPPPCRMVCVYLYVVTLDAGVCVSVCKGIEC